MGVGLSRRFSWIAFLALGLAGCAAKSREEYSLNPDGTGKIVFRYIAPLTPLYEEEEGENLDPEKAAQDRAREILEDSRGIEAWKDVQWSVNNKGLIVVQGTAYFRDLNAVEITGDALRPSLKENTAERMVLVFGDLDEEDDEEEEPAGKKPEKITVEERERGILAAKMRWQQARGFVLACLADAEVETIIHAPGEIEQAPTFEELKKLVDPAEIPGELLEIAQRLAAEKQPDGRSVRRVFRGDDLVKLMDMITANEEAWRRELEKEASPADGKAVNILEHGDRLAGAGLPFSLLEHVRTSETDVVVRKDGKPLFDYEKEVAAAKAGLADLKKRLGVTRPGPLGKKAEEVEDAEE